MGKRDAEDQVTADSLDAIDKREDFSDDGGESGFHAEIPIAPPDELARRRIRIPASLVGKVSLPTIPTSSTAPATSSESSSSPPSEAPDSLNESSSSTETKPSESKEDVETVAEETSKSTEKDTVSSTDSEPTVTKKPLFSGFKGFGSSSGGSVLSKGSNLFTSSTFQFGKRASSADSEKTAASSSADASEEDTKNEVDSSSSNTTANTPRFSFSGGFASGMKPKFSFMKPASAEEEDGDKDDEGGEPDEGRFDSSISAKVHVEKQSVETGEEDEENIFELVSKVLEIREKEENGQKKKMWLEMGVGKVRVNKRFLKGQDSSSFDIHVIGRHDKTLRVFLNGIVSSKHPIEKLPEKAVRCTFNIVNLETKAVVPKLLTLRARTVEETDKLHAALQTAKREESTSS